MFATVLAFNLVGDTLRAVTRSAPRRRLMVTPLLQSRRRACQSSTARGPLRAVDGVSFSSQPGPDPRHRRRVGLRQDGAVALDPAAAARAATSRSPGRCCFDGRRLTRLAPQGLRHLRGREIAIVFQDPMTSLNPVMTIGTQITESLRYHLGMPTRAAAAARRGRAARRVGIPEPERRLAQYPARAVRRHAPARRPSPSRWPASPSCSSPTSRPPRSTSPCRRQILDLLAREQRERAHGDDPRSPTTSASSPGRTDDIAVMYAGRVVERAPTRALFERMRMPVHRGAARVDPAARASRAHTPAGGHRRPPARPDATRRRAAAFAPRCRYAQRHAAATRSRRCSTADDAGRLLQCWSRSTPRSASAARRD